MVTNATEKHKNPVEKPVHELISSRWSPYEFDAAKGVSIEDLASVFEAARWSMSASNLQPWRYIVGNRNTDLALWNRVLDCLVEGNRDWARFVPVLALGLVQSEHEGNPILMALHDLGTASAYMTIEAVSRGLVIHQMAGIQADRIRESFALPDTLRPVTALAIGYVGSNPDLDPA
jgi:nitroreductase